MSDQLNFAVFLDFDNIAIGVKNTLSRPFDYRLIKGWLLDRGEVLTQIAYGNWNTHSDFKIVSRNLTQQGVKMEHLDTVAGGGKNGADIALSIDALELVFTHEHIDAYCILSGDSDFLPLVQKLKKYNKRVYIIAGTSFASENLRRNCHEFVSYEELSGDVQAPAYEAAPMDDRIEPFENAMPSVSRAIRAMQDEGEITYIRQIRTMVIHLEPEFDERRYGCDSFKDLIIRLVNAGYLWRRSLGEFKFCIEVADARGRSSIAAGNGRRHGPPREYGPSRDRRGHDGPPPVRGASYRSRRFAGLSDDERAFAMIQKAIRRIGSAGKHAEFDLLYKTVVDLDPDFRSYGCAHHGFHQFVSRFVQEGRVDLKSVGGTFVVALRGSRAPSSPEAGGLSAEARRLLAGIASESVALLQAGVPAKQLEAIVSTRPGFEPQALGVSDAEDLLSRAVRQGVLECRRDSGGSDCYFLPESLDDLPDIQERVSPPDSEEEPDPQDPDGTPEPDFDAFDTGPPPVAYSMPELPRARLSRPPESAPEPERPQAVEAALDAMASALRGNARLHDPGLSRRELRAAVKQADPTFDLAKFGFRTLRELLDQAQSKGFLEHRDDPSEGTLYVGSGPLAAPVTADAPVGGAAEAQRGGLLHRLLGRGRA